jgi:hypothetical protein
MKYQIPRFVPPDTFLWSENHILSLTKRKKNDNRIISICGYEEFYLLCSLFKVSRRFGGTRNNFHSGRVSQIRKQQAEPNTLGTINELVAKLSRCPRVRWY